jgi:hypothetical protein
MTNNREIEQAIRASHVSSGWVTLFAFHIMNFGGLKMFVSLILIMYRGMVLLYFE